MSIQTVTVAHSIVLGDRIQGLSLYSCSGEEVEEVVMYICMNMKYLSDMEGEGNNPEKNLSETDSGTLPSVQCSTYPHLSSSRDK